jgi:hypothetical protein
VLDDATLPVSGLDGSGLEDLREAIRVRVVERPRGGTPPARRLDSATAPK